MQGIVSTCMVELIFADVAKLTFWDRIILMYSRVFIGELQLTLKCSLIYHIKPG
jgi:hypothetical protein